MQVLSQVLWMQLDLDSEARLAARTLAGSTTDQRNQVLLNIADELEKNLTVILEANESDMDLAKASGMNQSLQDRLLLTKTRVLSMANAAREITKLPDPLNRVLVDRNLENGLNLKQKSVPFGVVGMVYEARPNVTVDAAVILIKSGNAALLRGSASAANSNKILIDIMHKAFKETSISPDVIQLVPSDDRSTVTALDKSADLEKAVLILINSKCDRPSTCNAAETLLIDSKIADKFLPIALKALADANVVINIDSVSKVVADKLGISTKLASEDSWSTEYGTLEINIAQVDGVTNAIEHILKYGTKHTEAIVAEDKEAIEIFTALNDCVAVMINTSTRFTDGEQMGFGAEIGISNQKMHARGPMGLEQMTTTTWIVSGNGQIRK